ncbi:MAG: dihydroneopterin aldolase [Gammaproteobacteria bacterium]|nr:dihydroneopterin aldolase [Gammaproteobacteria bacterium]
MDILYISQLRVETVIGVYEWERHIRQVVLLDLEIATDVARAAATDNIADALNYKAVAKRVAAFVEGTRFQLVETLAERVAERVLDEFGVPWVRLRVCKEGALRGVREVGILIERGRPN